MDNVSADVVQSMFKNGKSRKEIVSELQKTYGTQGISLASLKRFCHANELKSKSTEVERDAVVSKAMQILGPQAGRR